MAERRMFAKTIVTSDIFLDMPLSARCLYFTLGMFADDDGFVNNPKSIMRQTGASIDDLNILLAKKFVISFESGVIVIRHWKINNYLRTDRYRETECLEEKSKLITEKNGVYNLSGIPVVDQTDTQYSIGKNSIDKNSIDKNSIEIGYVDKKTSTGTSTETSTHNLLSNSISNSNSNIFNYWNSKNIIVHRELTNNINKSINKALKTYTEEEIKEYIDRYDKVLKDKSWFFDYKWSLEDFLNRKDGISSFTDEGSKWLSYVSHNEKTLREEEKNKVLEKTTAEIEKEYEEWNKKYQDEIDELGF